MDSGHEGKEVDDASVAACVAAAGDLRVVLVGWLRKNRPDLIKPDL
jgi:hypothetical protein